MIVKKDCNCLGLDLYWPNFTLKCLFSEEVETPQKKTKSGSFLLMLTLLKCQRRRILRHPSQHYNPAWVYRANFKPIMVINPVKPIKLKNWQKFLILGNQDVFLIALMKSTKIVAILFLWHINMRYKNVVMTVQKKAPYLPTISNMIHVTMNNNRWVIFIKSWKSAQLRLPKVSGYVQISSLLIR